MPELETGGEQEQGVTNKPWVALAGKVTLGVTVLGGLIGTLMEYRAFVKEMKEEKDAEIQEYQERLDKVYGERLQAREREFKQSLDSREMDFKTEMADQKLAVARANTEVNQIRDQISNERLERAERERSNAVAQVEKLKALARETERRAADATQEALAREKSAREVKRQLAETNRNAALYHARMRDHRRAILAMRQALDHLEGLEARATHDAYRAELQKLIDASPVYAPPEPAPTAGMVVGFRHDGAKPDRRVSMLVASPAQRRLAPRAFAPWTDAGYLCVNGLGQVVPARMTGVVKGAALFATTEDQAREVFAGADAHFVTCIATDPKRGLLAVGTIDGLVAIGEAKPETAPDATPRPLCGAGIHRGPVMALAFRPGHRELVSAGADGVLCRWRTEAVAADGTKSLVLERITSKVAMNGFIRCLAVSGDGELAATSGGDNAIFVWSMQNLGRRHVLSGHSAEVGALAFHPWREVVASQSWDGTVRLWDVSAEAGLGDERLLARLDAANDTRHLCLSFAADGASLLALCRDRAGFALLGWSVPGSDRRAKATSLDGGIRALGFDPFEPIDTTTSRRTSGGHLEVLHSCRQTVSSGSEHLRLGNVAMAVDAELKAHECLPLNAWAAGLHSETRAWFLERLAMEINELKGKRASWAPVLDTWFGLNGGARGYGVRLRRVLLGEQNDRPIRLDGMSHSLVAALDDGFSEALATGNVHQAHRMVRAQARFAKTFGGRAVADAVGPASAHLLTKVGNTVSRKTKTLQGFDPSLERRFGYTRAANHRLEAGQFTLSGESKVEDMQTDFRGEGSLLSLDYTWRRRSRGGEDTGPWIGVNVSGRDFRSYQHGVVVPTQRVFLNTGQYGIGALWGTRSTRGAWWMGAGIARTDVQYDNPTDGISFFESPYSMVVRLGTEIALRAARTGPDVGTELDGPLSVDPTPGSEGKRRQGLSFYCDIAYADWGLDEGDYLRFSRIRAGLRYYPSPYFGIGFHMPFENTKMCDEAELEWDTGGKGFRMSVMVQF